MAKEKRSWLSRFIFADLDGAPYEAEGIDMVLQHAAEVERQKRPSLEWVVDGLHTRAGDIRGRVFLTWSADPATPHKVWVALVDAHAGSGSSVELGEYHTQREAQQAVTDAVRAYQDHDQARGR